MHMPSLPFRHHALEHYRPAAAQPARAPVGKLFTYNISCAHLRTYVPATIILDRPLVLPVGVFSCLLSHQRPSFSDIQELAGKNWTNQCFAYRACSGVTILPVCRHGLDTQSVIAPPRDMGREGWGHNNQRTTSHVAPGRGRRALSIAGNLEAVLTAIVPLSSGFQVSTRATQAQLIGRTPFRGHGFLRSKYTAVPDLFPSSIPGTYNAYTIRYVQHVHQQSSSNRHDTYVQTTVVHTVVRTAAVRTSRTTPRICMHVSSLPLRYHALQHSRLGAGPASKSISRAAM